MSPASPRPAPTADAIEFIRFCHRRRRAGWPELYDEMCAVAARGLFRGWSHEELAQHGIGFSLSGMPALAALVRETIREDAAAVKAASSLVAVPVEGSAAAPAAHPVPVVAEPDAADPFSATLHSASSPDLPSEPAIATGVAGAA